MTVQILMGDCREILPTLPDQSVHCCVTSPPYFGLRDYGHAGQIGLEATPDAFVAEMVAVFREVRRVLRDDGTLWLNLGDSYAGSGKYSAGSPSHLWGSKQSTNAASAGLAMPIPKGLKGKDLIGIPWRVAFALQADGWYLRQDIIWSKPNPMPESVTDRCTKAHEYLFLLSKSPRYFYDAKAIAENAEGTAFKRAQREATADRVYSGGVGHEGRNDSGKSCIANSKETRNRRSVWEVTTQPFSEAHFAAFPPALIEPCILAGCPKGGTVLDPFAGAGTTGMVADRCQRNAILIELNAEYATMTKDRLRDDAGMFAVIG
jgi:DNA modification methylase